VTEAPQVPAATHVCTPVPSGAHRVAPGVHVDVHWGFPCPIVPQVLGFGLQVCGTEHSVATHWYPVAVAVHVLKYFV
jgi:hypothetical protein